MRPVIAHFKLQVDKKEKNIAFINNPLFILKANNLKNQNDHKLSTK